MKKLLVLIPLAVIMSSTAWSQDPAMNKNKVKPISLDGRSYKITLKSDATSTKDVNWNKDQKTTEVNDQSSYGTNTQSTTTTTPATTGTNRVDDVAIIKSDNNATGEQTTIDNTQKTNVDNTRVGAQTQTTQTITTDKMSQDKNKNEDMNSKNDIDMKSLDNKTMVIKFDNGMIHSSFLRTTNLDNCPYSVSTNTTSSVQESKTFKATCVQNEANYKATFIWDGAINGKNISGNLIKKMDDGKIVSYSFSGVETKSSDNSKDLGVR